MFSELSTTELHPTFRSMMNSKDSLKDGKYSKDPEKSLKFARFLKSKTSYQMRVASSGLKQKSDFSRVMLTDCIFLLPVLFRSR